MAPVGWRGRAQELSGEAVAVEDVVAEDQAHGSPPTKSAPMRKACARPSGRGLLGVGEVDAPVAAVAQQALEQRQVVRGGDDQDVADARQHQRRQRIVDHRLVVDRQELLADHAGRGYSRVPEPPARMMPFTWPSPPLQFPESHSSSSNRGAPFWSMRSRP